MTNNILIFNRSSKLFLLNHKYLFAILAIAMLSFDAFGQTKIKGVVRDENTQEPVIGAVVYIQSSTEGVTTNNEGVFEFTTRKSLPVTLVVSNVGYKQQEIEVFNVEESLQITIQEAPNALDEVVITAVGITRARREQGYSTTKVTASELIAGKSPNLAGGLVGKVPGLQINAISSGVNPNYRVVLRGNRSITGNNQALIVVDNAIVDNAFLGNVNPEDIADIQVLTGAAGATLYGSEASNGVLLITTKKGTQGKPKIRLSHTTTLEHVNFFPKMQSKFGQGSTADGQVFDPIENQQYGPAFDGSEKELGYPLENGDQQYATYSPKDDRTDFWETGIHNQTDLSFSIGTDRISSYIAAQYLNVTGTTPFDKYDRYSLRLNNSQQLLPNLSIDYNIGLVRNHYDTSTATATLYEQLLNIPANVPVLDYKDWEQGKWANPEGWFNPWYPNPYYTAANRRQDTRNTYLTGKIEAKWTILPWITAVYRASLSDRFSQNKQQVQKLTYSNYARTVQTKTNIAGSIYERSLNKYRLNQDFQLALNKSAGDFNFNLILGTSYSYIDEKEIVEEAAGLVIPDLFNIGNRVGTITGSAPVKTQKNYGVWGDFVAGYKNYLFLHVTGRNDWTSLLAKQNRSYFYPSADLSFIVTDAFSALNNHPVIDYLKIRGALSKTGNVNIDPYALLPTYSSVTGYSKGTYFTEGSDLVSPDLKPEITSGWELGTEFRLFKNFAEVQFNYYFTSTTGQAISASVARSSGYSGYLLNTGEVTNNGVETSLRLNPVRTRDWDLHVGGNYTHNKNFLKSLHPDAKRIGVNGSSVIFAEEGYEVNQIFVADYARDDKGRVIVDANTGYPSLGDSRRVGNTTPKHRLGVDLNLRFRNFTLSSLFEYRGGYYFASIDQGTLMDFVGSSARSAYYNRERFVFPNSSYLDPVSGQYVDNTNVTISDGGSGFWTNATYNRGARTNYVYSGDYWKWREASLTYKVPKTFLDRTTKGIVQELSISLQGRNLFLWTPESNEYTDPDYSANDNNAIGVSTLGQTPPSRYFGASLSFTF